MSGVGSWQQRLEPGPFGIGEVGEGGVRLHSSTLSHPAAPLLSPVPKQSLTCGSHPCLSLGRLRSVMLRCVLYFLVTSSIALGGYASPRTAASNTQVVAPTSTSTPAPVLISITVQQQGQVATHTLKLITTTTVINHTSETIGLLRNYVFPIRLLFAT